jgi:hypothetical protein
MLCSNRAVYLQIKINLGYQLNRFVFDLRISSGHVCAERAERDHVFFHSPVLKRTAEGRAVVAKIFATSTTLREGAYPGDWKLDER